MATYPPVPPPAPLSPPQKSNVLKWVLIGIGACFMMLVIAVVGIGMFVAHKAKQAGLDPDLIKRSPGLAAAKLMVAANPDVEMVSADEGKQVMTVRDKKTGKVYTMSFDDAKNGKFTMTENGKTTLTVGGKAKAPAWVPDYPASDPQGAFSAQGEDGAGGTFTFKTKDSSDKVIKYYQDQFKASGLNVTTNITNQNGQSTAGMLGAQDEAKKYTVTVILGVEGGDTTVAVTYATNK
jgi:hypothetical protein